jgi:hypothetical protein
MVQSVLKALNENHWYIIAGLLVATASWWTFGCISKTQSMMDDNKKVCRGELQAELEYYVNIAKARAEDLDRQDEIKQALLDAANVMSSTGTINPSGLINLAASIGGISFGLTQRQKLKSASKKNGTPAS